MYEQEWTECLCITALAVWNVMFGYIAPALKHTGFAE